MINKNVLFAAVLLMASAVCAEEPAQSLFNELSAAYSSGFYPGAVEYAERLDSAYPDSVFAARVLVMQGESLVRLGRSADAEKVLSRAGSVAEKDSVLMRSCSYWHGRAQFALQDYAAAAGSFFNSVRLSGTEEQYYGSSVLYGARSCYALGEYAKAAAPFAYVVANGKKYTAEDYEESVLKLAECYNKTGSYGKTLGLYRAFDRRSLSADVYELFSMYAGDACVGLSQYKNAFDLYSGVLASGGKKFAASALKKAYAVSSEHRDAVGTDAGTVLSQAQSTLSDFPELASEFWMRLGTDAYNRGEYANASRYFASADADAASVMKQTMALYRAEITFHESGAARASSYLEKAARDAGVEKNSTLYGQYASLMLKYAALQGKWEDVKTYSADVLHPDDATLYYTASACYGLGEYASGLTIVKNITQPDADVLALYARLLVKTQNVRDALDVYARIEKAGKMSGSVRLDYAETLLLAGKYAAAYGQAVQSGEADAPYVAGLAAFNSRDWNAAETSFTKFRSAQSGNGKYQQYALFYLGYAQYRSGKNAAAYATLSDFASKYPGSELGWNARITAANAAVQNGSYGQAAAQAEEAVKTAPDDQSREKAVLLCSGVYSDAGDFVKALAVLSPYTMQPTEFGMKCLYETAQIFVKQGGLEKADSVYQKIARSFPTADLAEESMYRRGEIYYTAKRYDIALSRFSEYESSYPGGTFTDASWYFSADCYARLGNTDRAILQNEALVKKFPESTYLYGARKNLMTMYRQTGDYDAALAQAKELLLTFGGQAGADGITKQAAELEKLASGSSEAIVRKTTEYEQKGGLTTPEGRKAGTELAALYAASVSTFGKAADLAAKLLEAQKPHLDQESQDAAANASVAGTYSRRTGKNSDAAALFLFAAKQFRASGKDDDAAAALYNAADAFRAAGKDGDADETEQTLKQLYPRSRQAESIDPSGR